MDIEIIKTKRKSIAIEIKRDLRIVVRAPVYMSDRSINEFVCEKSDWINRNIQAVKAAIAAREAEEKQPGFSDAELAKTVEAAKDILPPIAEYYARIIGVNYGKITVRRQVSRWGSCSAKGNLSFNCLLILCPDDVRDYVIIHELCHLKELNHSKRFWALVEQYCPNYRDCKNHLKTDGSELIRRLRNG